MDGTGILVSLAMLSVGYLGWRLGRTYKPLRFLALIGFLTILAGGVHLILSLGAMAIRLFGIVLVMIGSAGLAVSFEARPSAPLGAIRIVSFFLFVAGAVICYLW